MKVFLEFYQERALFVHEYEFGTYRETHGFVYLAFQELDRYFREIRKDSGVRPLDKSFEGKNPNHLYIQPIGFDPRLVNVNDVKNILDRIFLSHKRIDFKDLFTIMYPVKISFKEENSIGNSNNNFNTFIKKPLKQIFDKDLFDVWIKNINDVLNTKDIQPIYTPDIFYSKLYTHLEIVVILRSSQMKSVKELVAKKMFS